MTAVSPARRRLPAPRLRRAAFGPILPGSRSPPTGLAQTEPDP